PDIDGLFREQAGELDRKRREATLHRIQQLIYDKAMYAPVWELGFIHAHGSRVAESSLGLITGWAFSAPYEDVKLKSRERGPSRQTPDAREHARTGGFLETRSRALRLLLLVRD